MGAIVAQNPNLIGKQFNVVKYGAKANGIADDTVAIQNAVNAFKAYITSIAGVGLEKQGVLLFPPGLYRVTASLNLQKIYNHSFTIYAEGATIFASCAGKTVIDMLGSRFGTVYGLTIIGDSVNKPAIGIQTGRLVTDGSDFTYSDKWYFQNVQMSGYFTRSCYYGLQTEIDTWINCQLYNSYVTAEGAAWIVDGYNWTTYGAITDFQAPAQATNSAFSCSMHTFISCIGSVANGTPFIFIEAQIIKTLNTYVVSPNAEGCRYWSASGNVYGISWKVHSEGAGLTDTIVFNAMSAIFIKVYDLEIIDTLSQATNSIMKQGVNATALFVYNGVIDTGIKFQGTSTPFKGISSDSGILFNGKINGQMICSLYTGDINVDIGALAAPASTSEIPVTAPFTAPRTWTLPLLSKYPNGIKRRITDVAGGVSNGQYLKVIPAGSDTINGKTSWIMHNKSRSVEFESIASAGRWTAPPEKGDLRLGTQQDRTTNTTLSNVAGLVFTLSAGKTYKFRAILFITADATGGSKVAMGGTATATAIRYTVKCINLSATPPVFLYGAQQTAVAGSSGGAGGTSHEVIIEGTVVINAEGTFAPQFAENASSGTSSVLVGSLYQIEEIATL